MENSLATKARRARQEIDKAERRGGYLPAHNPYRLMPHWMPYWMASAMMWVLGHSGGPRKAPHKGRGKRRRSSSPSSAASYGHRRAA